MKAFQKINRKIPDILLTSGYRFLRHMLLQLCILCISINVFWDTPDQLILTTDRFLSWITYFLAIQHVVYLNLYWLAPRFLLTNQWKRYLCAVIALITGSLLLVGVGQSLFYHTSLPQEDNTNGMWALTLLNILSTIISVGLLIAGAFAGLLFRHWITYNQRIEALQAATLASELSFLKSQINPHFLFNILNNAHIMAGEDPEVASGILAKLEKMLRYQIHDSAQEQVSLQKDIRFLTRFLELEQMRRDRFDYSLTVTGETADRKVPPLLFIPFVENAVKHGADSETGAWVHIRFHQAAGRLTFTCSNSRPRHPVKKAVGGIGLANIRRRLELLYPKNHRLEVTENETDYTVILEIGI